MYLHGGGLHDRFCKRSGVQGPGTTCSPPAHVTAGPEASQFSALGLLRMLRQPGPTLYTFL